MDEKKYKDLSVHEIKNMVSAISGYAELIARGIIKDAKAVEMAGKIHSQSMMLSAFLDKKYIYELLTGGLYTPEWMQVNLGILLENIIEEKLISRDKLQINKEQVNTMSGDTYLLKEMIGHLLDNALKYTCDINTVYVNVGQMGDEVVIKISNEAEEMTIDEIAHLPEPYYRRDKNKSRKLGSQGMGLSIVSEIVKLHNGRLQLASENGRFCVQVYFKITE